MDDRVDDYNRAMGLIFLPFIIGGIGFAVYAGANGFEWFSIFIGSGIIAIGYVIVRAPIIRASGSGFIGMLITQAIMWAIVTGVAYFIGSAFS
jgi:hypothetical protein